MGTTQHLQCTTAASSAQNAYINSASSLFWPVLISNFFLSALSIANLGIISSMVAFLLDQKHNVQRYEITSPGLPFFLNVEPAHLWVDQGHTSNGVAGYGFFLGLFGMFVAWRVRRATQPSKLLIALVILQFLAVLFTLSALIFVFIVTNQTKGQSIRIPIAANAQGQNYPEYKWTPETWFKAVLDLPLADKYMRDEIDSKITNMVTWRWMLVPILAADVIAFGVTTLAWLRQRKGMTARPDSANTVDK
ncbi:hypothetical protein HBI56_069140 [Parastagonospora nodorum]|uniref:Uncharacterized protein n=1 Tax=Phaeosphaeria nodorum (strain SN15 / ATCC MYA-4574 / FGSC 10173) TaxID=321614 RepID=A0A7U2ENU8_PHANO|nr:hypothetical protein HBH56_003580 [Parastagonospora nodorum]QRC90279.1 hypothetical protein JI435_096870 [Parastagonospora nodorum SN15]KAH3937638.1 hypothetical protein HBH54_003570 [Parastagonospora nodorum]KAH3946576.1 hypothetical protein HBH53_128420 [Parastagonospora nodorum]KAH3975120.1 hypothetical protein HBH51_086340 [Parastagonospora nodorum]